MCTSVLWDCCVRHIAAALYSFYIYYTLTGGIWFRFERAQKINWSFFSFKYEKDLEKRKQRTKEVVNVKYEACLCFKTNMQNYLEFSSWIVCSLGTICMEVAPARRKG